MQAVDTLITTVEAALLTLNELDPVRYARLDSVLDAEQYRFAQRFEDTLDRGTADTLGNMYLMLRAAGDMGRDHERLVQELNTTVLRLRALRTDLELGAMRTDEAATAVSMERMVLRELEVNVHRAIDNYRLAQRTGDELSRLPALLGETTPTGTVQR
jgi:hypothetical protein